jgi:hypothetical protein
VPCHDSCIETRAQPLRKRRALAWAGASRPAQHTALRWALQGMVAPQKTLAVGVELERKRQFNHWVGYSLWPRSVGTCSAPRSVFHSWTSFPKVKWRASVSGIRRASSCRRGRKRGPSMPMAGGRRGRTTRHHQRQEPRSAANTDRSRVFFHAIFSANPALAAWQMAKTAG